MNKGMKNIYILYFFTRLIWELPLGRLQSVFAFFFKNNKPTEKKMEKKDTPKKSLFGQKSTQRFVIKAATAAVTAAIVSGCGFVGLTKPDKTKTPQ